MIMLLKRSCFIVYVVGDVNVTNHTLEDYFASFPINQGSERSVSVHISKEALDPGIPLLHLSIDTIHNL